ncbi:MAG: DJ-1/PfpI family protein [Candidatus Promineifilaceae bacterium]
MSTDAESRFLEIVAPDAASMAAVNPSEPRHVVMLAYPGMFALDMVGPLAVLGGLRNTTLHQLWKSAEAIQAGKLAIVPTGTLEDCPEKIDVLLVPGGTSGTLNLMKDPDILAFVRDAAARSRYVTSVCTGSLILAAAGLLEGRRATTHWATMDVLPTYGATPVEARYVEDGNVITAAGVSAGIDFALMLAAKLTSEPYAKSLQLDIEYDPAPPFNAGSPRGAGEPLASTMKQIYAPLVERMQAAA